MHESLRELKIRLDRVEQEMHELRRLLTQHKANSVTGDRDLVGRRLASRAEPTEFTGMYSENRIGVGRYERDRTLNPVRGSGT
jgi:hypothetical protein